jgi:hypothetical protein
MLTIAVVPLLGLLSLFLLFVFTAGRRASSVARMKAAVDQLEQTVRQREQQLVQETLQELVAGKAAAETFKTLLGKRAALVEGNPNWDEDDLKQMRKKRLAAESEAINRRLMLPAVAAAVGLVAACVIAIAALYHFHAGSGEDYSPNESVEQFDHQPSPMPHLQLESTNRQ